MAEQTADKVVKFTDATHFDVTKDYTIEDFLASIGGPNAKMYPVDTMWAISQAIGKKWGVADGSITEAQLGAELKRKMSFQQVALYKGEMFIDFTAQVVTLTGFGLVLSDYETHPQLADSINSTVDISGRDAALMYSVVAEMTDNIFTEIKMVKYNEVADNQYVIAAIFGEDVALAGTSREKVKIKHSARAAEFEWGIVSSYQTIVVDKSAKTVTVTGTPSVITDGLQKVGNIPKQVVDYVELFDDDTVVDTFDLTLVYDTTKQAVQVCKYTEVPLNCLVLCVFQQSGDFFITKSSPSAFSVIDQTGLYINPTSGYINYRFAKPNGAANVIIDRCKKEIRFSSTVTVVTDDMKTVMGIKAPQTIDISGSTAGTVYALVVNVASKSFEVYKYNEIPRDTWIICSFKLDVEMFTCYGNKEAFVLIDGNGVQTYPAQLPSRPVIPRMRMAGGTLPVGHVGRWIEKDGGLYTTNLGSYLYSRIVGAAKVTIDIESTAAGDNPPMVAIRIDDGEYKRVPVTSMPLDLEVSSEAHILTIVTAGNSGESSIWAGSGGFQFKALTLDAGTATAIEPAGRTIAWIGDSITAGNWVAGDQQSIDYRPESNYAAVTSATLGTADYRCAYGGVGATKDGSGDVEMADGFVSKIDATTLAPMAEAIDIAVVNIGTNDRYAPVATFNDNYKKMIAAVKSTYPGAFVVMMVPFAQTRLDDLETIATDLGLPLIQTAGWGVTTGVGTHPDAAGTQTAAKKLTGALREMFGDRYFG